MKYGLHWGNGKAYETMVWFFIVSLTASCIVIALLLRQEPPFQLEPYVDWWPGLGPPPLPEPWRERYEGIAIELPTHAIQVIADPRQICKIEQFQQDGEILLRKDILTNGLQEPLIMVIDNQGRMTLHDGYHRLVAVAEDLQTLPVLVVRSERIRTHGKPTQEVFESFFR